MKNTAKKTAKKAAKKTAKRRAVRKPAIEQPRDRIKGLRRVRAGDLVPHPKNWREHPESQRNALRGVLNQIGWADANIARELPDGRLQILDGHLRADLDAEYRVPVLVVDLDDAEAELLLASHDALTVSASQNADKLDALLDGLAIEDQALADLLAQVVHDSRAAPEPPAASSAVASADPTAAGDDDRLAGELAAAMQDDEAAAEVPVELPDVEIPESFALLVQVDGEADQRELYQRLTAEGYRCRVLTI